MVNYWIDKQTVYALFMVFTLIPSAFTFNKLLRVLKQKTAAYANSRHSNIAFYFSKTERNCYYHDNVSLMKLFEAFNTKKIEEVNIITTYTWHVTYRNVESNSFCKLFR